MKPYEFLDHTADIKVVARGKNLAKAFENAAIATFEVMTDTTKIQPNMTKTIEIENEKLTTLLYDFIDELIFLMDTQAFLLKHCKNTTLTKQEKKHVQVTNNSCWRHTKKTLTNTMSQATSKAQRITR